MGKSNVSFMWGKLIFRIIFIMFLLVLWLNGDAVIEALLLIMILIAMAVARWRFELPAWTILVDQLACILVIPLWPQAWLGMALPLFESALKGKTLYSFPLLLVGAAYAIPSIFMLFFLLLSLVSGWLMKESAVLVRNLQIEADQDRQNWYELEKLKGELLEANIKTAHMAELTERNRIARDLHDHVGHELTGAVLALQAFEQLWKEDNAQAEEMFKQMSQRLNDSASYLRETVHNTKPDIAMGSSRLERICESYQACKVTYQTNGDTNRVPAYIWGILESVLKEALTNVYRHSNANHVEVSLDVSKKIVRLLVADDGKTEQSGEAGIGIRNLRTRAKAVGGNISFSSSDRGFQLVSVLPLESNHIFSVDKKGAHS
ncbi:sensor histidine kinase [Virgibacillus sp. NKC19-16]|uniref:sensor histidine kinase n=1 Tax=Virgibacillus salidurans TaxID=2831673 RepID=UPI001F26BF94|nr:sensor histidine kinase [Virgibacillus sp. NKC19-16]UJL47656.1 sensor histidine kinase [Virgibacillus sp. NKC19-16]